MAAGKNTVSSDIRKSQEGPFIINTVDEVRNRFHNAAFGILLYNEHNVDITNNFKLILGTTYEFKVLSKTSVSECSVRGIRHIFKNPRILQTGDIFNVRVHKR